MTTLPIERIASEREAEKFEAEAEAAEAQAEADRQKADASRLKEGAGGLYGYTKGTQRDVEASIRKAQRRAASVAKTLYAKDERSVDFLKAHAKRANSKTARLLLAAMKNIGPRVASDKTAGSKLTPAQIDEIKGEMVKNGVPVRFMKGGGSLNIETGQTTPRGANVMHQIVYWNFTKETAKKIADWLGARASFDKTAAMLPSERHASIYHASEQEQLEYVVDALRLAGEQGLRVDSLPRKGALAAQSKGLADAERGYLYITRKGRNVRMAAEEKVAGGLYGYPTKTARLALVACSDLRAYVGEVAYGLHSRRTARYDRITGFLKEHGKTAKCAYSRMILSCYPDAPVSKQAKEKYPWDECIADQEKQYGSKETAEKVCGKIKAQSQGKSAGAKKKVAPHMYVISEQGDRFMITRGDPNRGGSKMILRGDDYDVRDWLDDNKRKISKDHMIDLTRKFDIPAEYSDFYMKVQGKSAGAKDWRDVKLPRSRKDLWGFYWGLHESLERGNHDFTEPLSDVSDADLRKAVQRLVEQVGSHEMLGVEYVEKMKKQAPRAYKELNGIMGGKLASSEMLRKAFVPDSVDGWLEWEDGTRAAASKTASWKVTVRHGPYDSDYREVEDFAEDYRGEVVDSGNDGNRLDYSEVHFSDKQDSLDFVDAAARKGMRVTKSFRAASRKTAMTSYEKNQKAMLAEAGDSLKRMYDPAKLAQAIVKMRSFKKMVGNSVDMVKDALIALEEGGAIRRLDDDLFFEVRDEAERLMFPRRRASTRRRAGITLPVEHNHYASTRRRG